LALTEDKKAAQAISLILRALHAIRNLVEVAEVDQSPSLLVDRAGLDKLSDEIDVATEQLKSYAVCELGVTAYDEHGRPVNKLDILSSE
jgi:hypothetical protein